jgi:hypothetical protein
MQVVSLQSLKIRVFPSSRAKNRVGGRHFCRGMRLQLLLNANTPAARLPLEHKSRHRSLTLHIVHVSSVPVRALLLQTSTVCAGCCFVS